MDPRKLVLKQTALLGAGELLLSAALVAVFAALGKFEMNVLWGALVGCLTITGNHFFLCIAVNRAADRAEAGDPKGAQAALQLSGTVRLVAMGAVLVAAILLGCNAIAAALPLAFARPILMVADFFGKKGD